MKVGSDGMSRLLALALPAAMALSIAACSDSTVQVPCETNDDCGADEVCSDALVCEPSDTPDAGDVGGDTGDTDEPIEEVCGDGIVSGEELCDSDIPFGEPGGCPIAADCEALSEGCEKFALRGTFCQRRCELVETITEPSEEGDFCCPDGANAANDPDCSSVCGNGVFEPGEDCDDGELNGQPGQCNNSCTGFVPVGCGNGFLEEDEECDDGEANSDTAPNACRTDCSLPTCGDGVTDDGEVCDDGAQNGEPNQCASDCQGTTPSVCGNGVIEADEICDDGELNGEPNQCASDCSGLTAANCGNGVVEEGEVCDDGAANGTPNSCNGSCSGVTPSVCGNGVVEAGEDCDDSGESATCNADCSFATCGDGVLNASAGEVCDDGDDNSDTAPDACRTDCTEATCGDGVVDSDEVCDTAGNSATCNANCTAPVCGDGILNTAAGEACDDGDDNSDTAADACRTDCSLPTCGDGVVDSGEACDDGGLNGQPLQCNSTCTGITQGVCGNGVVEGDEQCDDGAANSNTTPDACRTNCRLPFCGDGVADTGEACDDGAANSNTTPNACRTNCSEPVCGDGVVDTSFGETCDDGPLNGEPNQCASDCQGTTPAVCGNGVVESGETCDDGAQNGQPNQCNSTCNGTTPAVCGNGVTEAGEDCDTSGESATCNDDCTFASCGDGILNTSAGEACDDGAANSDTAPNACRTDCSLPICGDGVVDSGEECDDGVNDGSACNADCTTPVAGPTAFRVTRADILDPNIWISVPIFGCRNFRSSGLLGQLPSGINGLLNESIQDPDENGEYGLSIAAVFRPLDQAPTATGDAELHFPTCTEDSPVDICVADPDSQVVFATFENRANGVCLNRLPGSGAPTPEGWFDNAENTIGAASLPTGTASSPCFVTPEVSLTLDVAGIDIPLTGARLAANYQGDPATGLVTGLLRGFVSLEAANAVLLPDDLPLVGGQVLSRFLHNGPSSCRSSPARDVGPAIGGGTTTGWWFYLSFTAELVDWVE